MKVLEKKISVIIPVYNAESISANSGQYYKASYKTGRYIGREWVKDRSLILYRNMKKNIRRFI